MMLLALMLACKAPVPAAERGPEVRFRPAEVAPNDDAAELLSRVPNATWDLGLARAASLLTAAGRDPAARLSPLAVATALGEAGYPGPASFARELNGGAFPEQMVAEMVTVALQRQQPVDVAISRRNYADGTVLWIGGIAHRPALLDAIDRDPPLDELLPVLVEPLQDLAALTLFVASPEGPVRAMPLKPLQARWVEGLNVPGPWRFEVVADDGKGGDAQVVLLWSNYVDSEPPPMPTLLRPSTMADDPMAATEQLYAALDSLRDAAGLPRLKHFEPYEELAREHAALMAASGQVAHVLSTGASVAGAAGQRYHPAATHQEDVAAAANWEEARELVELSPGHRRVLLCESCTHVAIGAALEPTLDAVPRLFVVWELLSFPNGEPRSVDRTQR